MLRKHYDKWYNYKDTTQISDYAITISYAYNYTESYSISQLMCNMLPQVWEFHYVTCFIYRPVCLFSSQILYLSIKTHGSESQGQQRAKRITKNNMRDELLCVFYTNERFRNMTS